MRSSGLFAAALFAGALLVLQIAACGSAEPAGCVDNDGDGLGVGCEGTEDCDDTNPLRTTNCDTVPAPDCSLDPFQTGCSCQVGLTAACYSGDEGTEDVGTCVGGRRLCTTGYWGLCLGETIPTYEVCDGLDEDCDGLVDEVVASPCGECVVDCVGGVWGNEAAPFAAGEGLAITSDGALTLERVESVGTTIWIPNSGDGTLSKIDGTSNLEVARYSTGGHEPSRVAVDYYGDVFVANREFGGVSTLRKIAGDPSRCVDRDGDGEITTSGGASVVADDECVLFTVEIGETDGVARALAIDGDRGLDDISGGNVWVGLHGGQAIVEVNGYDGSILDRVETPGFAPYAAAFDPRGRLWAIDKAGYLLSIDRFESLREAEIIALPLRCYNLYGMALENDGRVVMTGYDCNQVIVYDALLETWTLVPTPPSVRGAIVRETSRGAEAWVAHTDGRVSVLDVTPTPALRGTFSLSSDEATPLESIGIGVDDNGRVWAASTLGGEGGVGLATRLNAETGVIEAQVPVGFAPHVQGDLTGGRLLANFVPEASTEHIFTGCSSDSTRWQRVHSVADIGLGGELAIAIRWAEDEASLSAAEYVELGLAESGRSSLLIGSVGGVQDGGVLQVRITLRAAARDGAPLVREIGVQWICDGPD